MNESMVAEDEYFGMGTIINAKAYGPNAKVALKAARLETQRLEGILSRFNPESEISRINNSAGICCERVSIDTYKIIAKAANFSEYCKGCFDVTVGPLIDLWIKYKERLEIPQKSLIDEVLPYINYTDVEFEPDERTVFLKKPGQSINLGGIGKGFAANKILEVLKEHGITSAFTNLGGNVATIGTKPDGSCWNIGIRHTRKDNSVIGVVSVVGKSVVTSGDYQIYYIAVDGKKYHHILDPVTGYPSESGLASATIIAENSMVADAISTGVFVAGMYNGLDIIKKFSGVEAVFIDSNLKVYITQGLKEHFSAFEKMEIYILD